MDLIDRRQAVKIIDEIDTFCGGWRDYAIERIMDLPPAEKRGKWVKDEQESLKHIEAIYRCSACNNFEAWGETEKYNFCPNCGAEMESEE